MRYLILVFCLTAAPAQALCVSAFQTRLRAEPSSSAKITWVVGRYMPLVEVERRGGWIKVRDVDGDSHWVPSGDVSGRERCVVVKVQFAGLRTGPGATQPLAEIQAVDRYTAFKRLEADPEEWFHVEDETGSKFWISASAVWRPTTVSRIGF
jgi:SH3-like domain-containing protein